ncbi:choline kinase, cytoplasm [Gloeophyllum trabeum ATCC 11539]|uniref:Choline kinase, cytoplasm n=1 Tax=Gloeophyllum trabeum (strain ATCC 11539 / FP-39264 / Madison 617) TaxID=670483 RepID=S7QNA1_GLOTA|nr:choline kinase, cytoplasm [Gloeophyllum trabeum ATCC 11539]EPQ60981.1 choline kinase, cytoplasm [Gloeophyllum trabeum ATCC 11539]
MIANAPPTVSPPLMTPGEVPIVLKRDSSGSRKKGSIDLGPAQPDVARSRSSSTSSLSIPFRESDAEVVTVEGLPHADVELKARQYKTATFAQTLLCLLRTLNIPSWCDGGAPTDTLMIQKVSGSLTNAVFFVSRSGSRTLLLRIYGASSASLISRPRELHTLYILSSRYRIGPRIYGTFGNGRVEEYFDSVPLTAEALRDPKVSRWIGARMAELHCVDVDFIEGTSPDAAAKGGHWEIAATKNFRSWLPAAREVLSLPAVSPRLREELDLDTFEREWERYMLWLDSYEHKNGASPRVFCHNDTQYGNLLRLTSVKEGMSEHRQIIVVDFEYSSANAAAFDMANHFHEWTANYHTTTPHLLTPSLYPTVAQRRNFYQAYLSHYRMNSSSSEMKDVEEFDLHTLDSQVQAWSPASHAFWAVWGIVQAREDLENGEREPEFDYIGYAKCRMDGFRREVQALYEGRR